MEPGQALLLMALGVLAGVLAGAALTLLLVLALRRRRHRRDWFDDAP